MAASPVRTGFCHLASDASALLLAVVLSYSLRLFWEGSLDLHNYLTLLILIPSCLCFYAIMGLYPGIFTVPQEELRRLSLYTTTVFIGFLAFTFLSRTYTDYSRFVLMSSWFLSLILVPTFRAMVQKKYACEKWWGHDLIICAEKRSAENIYNHLLKNPNVGLKPMAVCFLDNTEDKENNQLLTDNTILNASLNENFNANFNKNLNTNSNTKFNLNNSNILTELSAEELANLSTEETDTLNDNSLDNPDYEEIEFEQSLPLPEYDLAKLPAYSLDESIQLAKLPSKPYALLQLEHINFDLQQIANRFIRHFNKTLFIFSFLLPLNLWLISTDLSGAMALETHQKLLDPLRQKIKRGLDIILTLLGSVIFLPLGLILALLIRLEDKGSALYWQKRRGKNGKLIRVWKFRTMVPNAAKKLEEYLAKNPKQAKEWKENHKLTNDPRITRIGNFLRKTSLDELPQLWNVLKGDLSLVGPRPIVSQEIEKYGEAYKLYCQVRPGLTGLWQVSGRSRLAYDKRVRLDSYYIRNWSVWLDIYILACTPLALVNTKNAC